MTGCTSMASNSEDLKAFILSLEEQALKLWNRRAIQTKLCRFTTMNPTFLTAPAFF